MAGRLTRRIRVDFWIDPWVETLSPIERYLYIYLVTTPQSNPAGIFHLSVKRMVFDTDVERDAVETALARFVADGKISYDSDTGILWIHAFRKVHVNPRAGWNNAIARGIDAIPDCPIKQQYLAVETRPDPRYPRKEARKQAGPRTPTPPPAGKIIAGSGMKPQKGRPGGEEYRLADLQDGG